MSTRSGERMPRHGRFRIDLGVFAGHRHRSLGDLLGRFVIVLFVSAGMASAACLAQRNDDDPLREELISTAWTKTIEQSNTQAKESSTWEFREDGTFRVTHVSDFREVFEGAWITSQVKSDASIVSGFVFLWFPSQATNPRFQFEALSIVTGEGQLRLAGETYQRTEPTEPPRPTTVDAADADPRLQSPFRLWQMLADSEWVPSQQPPSTYPRFVSFADDGRFTARLGDEGCEYSGMWSLRCSDSRQGEIVLSVPRNPCDPRARNKGLLWNLPVRLVDNALWLNRTSYEPIKR